VGDGRLLFRGPHLVHVRATAAELFEVEHERLRPIATIDLTQLPSALELSSRSPSLCWRTADHDSCWIWEPHSGARRIAARQGRDLLSVGFIETASQTLLAIATGAELRILDTNDSLLNTVELRRPHAWNCHRFTALPGARVAITGNLFSDPLDMVLTIDERDLLSDRDALQRAIETGRQLHDRAEKLVVGSGPGETAIAMRDPADEEPAEDRDEDTADVWGLRGYYLRRLSDSELITTGSYRGEFDKRATIAANDRVVALEVPGGVDVIDRRDQSVRRIGGGLVALDPVNFRVGVLGDDGSWRVEDL
jgi:hypothetical protein